MKKDAELAKGHKPEATATAVLLNDKQTYTHQNFPLSPLCVVSSLIKTIPDIFISEQRTKTTTTIGWPNKSDAQKK